MFYTDKEEEFIDSMERINEFERSDIVIREEIRRILNDDPLMPVPSKKHLMWLILKLNQADIKLKLLGNKEDNFPF